MHKSFSLMETEKEATGNALCLCLGLSLLCPYAESPLPRHICKLWHSYETQQPKFHSKIISALSLCLPVSLCLCVSVSLSFLSHGSEISVEQTVFCSYSNGKQTYQTNKRNCLIHSISFLSFLLSQKSKQRQQAKTSKFSFCSSHKHENKLVIRKHPQKFRKTES